MKWRENRPTSCGGGFHRVKLMGIVNVTPDSFFDGGKYTSLQSALRHAEKMVEEGADILDVGGESSRPGADSVPVAIELKRVLPVVKELKKKFPKIPVSVDTQKSQVAAAALVAGAEIINDISSLRTDPKMIEVLLKAKPQVILMHMQGTPKTMQKNPKYTNVVKEVKQFLNERIQLLVKQGFPRKNIWIDPGIGFGKKLEHNLELLRHLKEFSLLGQELVLGCSRKSFIGLLLADGNGPLPPQARLEGSLACALWAVLNRVSILRVHDVGATKKMLKVFAAIGNFN